MAATAPRRRHPPAPEAPVPDIDVSSKPPTRLQYDRNQKDYGLFLQIVRSLLLLTWFNGCIMCIVAMQLIGLPIYFVSRRHFNSYIAITKRAFGITITALTEWFSPTPVRVSGDSSVVGQIGLKKDGTVATKFPDRLVLIANHQVYTDWLYLWWVAYTNGLHGHIYIILKESLKYIPFMGQGMTLYGFIFMARNWAADKPRLRHRLEKLKTMHPVSPQRPLAFDPMWLLIFPEGTNLSFNTKRRSDAYCKKQGITAPKHELLPRSTGLFFCLQQLKGSVDWVYDCTIGYEGPPKGTFPDVCFSIRSTYLRGRPPKVVNFYWRRFAISDIPLDDQKEFERWFFERWAEKDQLLDQFIETGRFPPFGDEAVTNGSVCGDGDGKGFIESEIMMESWSDLASIFGVLFAVALVLSPWFWSFLF